MEFAQVLQIARRRGHEVASQREVDHNRIYTCQHCGASFTFDKTKHTVINPKEIQQPCLAQ